MYDMRTVAHAELSLWCLYFPSVCALFRYDEAWAYDTL